LVRIKKEDGRHWLLIKKDDEFASSKDILKLNKSVLSGKLLEKRKRKAENSKKTSQKANLATSERPVKLKKAAPLKSARKLAPVKPMLAKLTDKPFNDPNWLFEVKYDGYRAITVIQHHVATMYSRNLTKLNRKYPMLIMELQTIAHDVILDGEIVAENKKGKSVFQLLQNKAVPYEPHELRYYVFDLLSLGGHDLSKLPLSERKELLNKLFNSTPGLKSIRFSGHVAGKGVAFYKKAQKQHQEGIMAKEKDGIYHKGRRSGTWLKIKIQHEQEMVIIGLTDPKGGRKHFGSILLGYYENGKLVFGGKCGTGFSESTLKEIYEKSSPYFTDSNNLKGDLPKGNTQWVKPKLVCQVRFTEWTRSGKLRHPVYIGLRNDKRATQVRREKIVKH
jgi:bifunctional non-homologous end joining protein LigD